jgi:glycerol uptake facilitator-like aquaporin
MSSMPQRLGAEFLGTFWLVLGGCGSAVLAAAFPELGIGLLGVALARSLYLHMRTPLHPLATAQLGLFLLVAGGVELAAAVARRRRKASQGGGDVAAQSRRRASPKGGAPR